MALRHLGCVRVGAARPLICLGSAVERLGGGVFGLLGRMTGGRSALDRLRNPTERYGFCSELSRPTSGRPPPLPRPVRPLLRGVTRLQSATPS